MTYDSIYRGLVVDVDDPEQRLRIKVSIPGIHADSSDVGCLPWAEVCSHSGRGMRGLYVPYLAGDWVWVQFEGGNPLSPVVIGAAVTRAAGVNDIPFDMQGDFSGGRRIILVSEDGSRLEMSADPKDQSLKIISGAASVTVSSKDDGIELDARGRVIVKGSTVSVQAAIAEVKAATVNIDADDGSKGNAVATLDSNHRTDVLADDEVNIGGRVENVMGVPSAFRTATKTNVRGVTVNIGTNGTDTDAMPAPVIGTAPPAPLPATIAVNIKATTSITLQSLGAVGITSATSVSISAPSVNITP